MMKLQANIAAPGITGFPHFSDMKIPYFFKTFSRLKFDFSRPGFGLFATKKKGISNVLIVIYSQE